MSAAPLDSPAYAVSDKVPVLDESLIDPLYQTMYVNPADLPTFPPPNLYNACLPEVRKTKLIKRTTIPTFPIAILISFTFFNNYDG